MLATCLFLSYCRCVWRKSKHSPVSAYLSSRDLFYSHDSFVLEKQTSQLCVCVFGGGGTIMATRYRLLHPGHSARFVGTLSELPDKHLVRVRMITKQTSHRNIDSFLLGPMFTAQWLAHLPYTPVMETRLHVACSKLSIRLAVVSMVTQHYQQWCTDRLLLEFRTSAV